MKKTLIVALFLLTCLFVSSSQAFLCNGKDLGCLASWILPDNQTEGDSEEKHEWSACNGKIIGYDDVIVFYLKFNEESLKTLSYENSWYSPKNLVFNSFALEIDVCDPTGTLEFYTVDSTFPDSAKAIEDTGFCDSINSCSNSMGMIVRNPGAIVPGKEYEVVFYLKTLLPEDGVVIKPSLQISADMHLLEDAKLIPGGDYLVDNLLFFEDYLDQYDYFAIEADCYISGWKVYRNGSGSVCWNNKETSYNCSSGDDTGDTGGSTDPGDGEIDTGGDGDTGTVNPPPINPDSDPDLHISRFHIREVGDDEYHHSVEKTLEWGSSFKIEGELKVRNESSRKAEDVDSDYRVENKKDFDDNDVKIDEDSLFDINSGEKVTKGMSAVTIGISDDGKSVKVSGDKSKTFPVENGFAKIYLFADVEEDDGDHDISSESDSDEYGVVEITAIIPNYLPRGYVDTVDCSKIRGWVKDQNTSKSLEIHVYQMDNLRNSKSFLTAFDAKSYRSDLGGNWGFVWYPPSSIKDGRTRILQFYAINVPRGDNPLLINGEFQFTCYAEVAGKEPVYRLYSTVIKDHLYTISESEKNTVSSCAGWRGEGARWLAFSVQKQGTVPMYRLYNGTDHFLVRSLNEKNSAVKAGWKYERIAFYLYASQKDGTIPLYRLYHSVNTDHFYTTDKFEKDSAVKIYGYRYEGIEGYVYPLN